MRLLKRLIKAMNLDEKQVAASGDVVHHQPEDEGLRPHHIQSYGNWQEQTRRRCIRPIRKMCAIALVCGFRRATAARLGELWLNKPHILQHYRERLLTSSRTNSVM